MLEAGENWIIPFMDFVDDFRRTKDMNLIRNPLSLSHERFDSLSASTIEYLCHEMDIEPPDWVWEVPPPGIEMNLKVQGYS